MPVTSAWLDIKVNLLLAVSSGPLTSALTRSLDNGLRPGRMQWIQKQEPSTECFPRFDLWVGQCCLSGAQMRCDSAQTTFGFQLQIFLIAECPELEFALLQMGCCDWSSTSAFGFISIN